MRFPLPCRNILFPAFGIGGLAYVSLFASMGGPTRGSDPDRAEVIDHEKL